MQCEVIYSLISSFLLLIRVERESEKCNIANNNAFTPSNACTYTCIELCALFNILNYNK